MSLKKVAITIRKERSLSKSIYFSSFLRWLSSYTASYCVGQCIPTVEPDKILSVKFCAQQPLHAVCEVAEALCCRFCTSTIELLWTSYRSESN